MAARGSQHSQDEITWQTAGLKLGQVGLDLRRPSDPRSLTKLLNARFIDERNLQRRNGYLGTMMLDSSSWPQLRDGGSNLIACPMNPINWTYGFGMQLTPGNAQARGDE